MSPRPVSSFWIAHAILPMALFAVLAATFEFSDLDLRWSDPFYDVAARRWPLAKSWWADRLIHERGRDLIAAIGGLAILCWIASFGVTPLRRQRRRALFLALSIGLGTGAVAIAQTVIDRHCPRDMARYGGSIPYTKLFRAVPDGFPAGHCFPAAHASGGFALMSGYFAFRGQGRRRALAALVIGICVGCIFGFGQLVRGAHFASHNVWSAAICWFVALGLYLGPFRSRFDPSESA